MSPEPTSEPPFVTKRAFCVLTIRRAARPLASLNASKIVARSIPRCGTRCPIATASAI